MSLYPGVNTTDMPRPIGDGWEIQSVSIFNSSESEAKTFSHDYTVSPPRMIEQGCNRSIQNNALVIWRKPIFEVQPDPHPEEGAFK